MVRSAGYLTQMINDILDISKIDAGKMELFLEQTKVDSFVESLVNELSGLAEERNLNLQFTGGVADFEMPLDRLRMKQVLFNLVGNALKFTEDGGVTVSTRINDNLLEIAVVDTGSGISENDIAKLFSPFTQVDNSATRKAGGTGLGLAISKRMVELHGGIISVNSVVGVGSSFVIHLPRE